MLAVEELCRCDVMMIPLRFSWRLLKSHKAPKDEPRDV
jgi:hypothetical protein